jgi:hypothetical protein
VILVSCTSSWLTGVYLLWHTAAYLGLCYRFTHTYGQYLLAAPTKRHRWKIGVKDRFPLGGGAVFFLVQDSDWFIKFETSPDPPQTEKPLGVSRERGRIPAQAARFLGNRSSFYVLKDGSVVRHGWSRFQGHRRDNTRMTFSGI